MTNPYTPPTPSSSPREVRQPVRGFARGARNGFLWSLPFAFGLVFASSRMGIAGAIANTAPMVVLWILVAGFVAQSQDSKFEEEDRSNHDRDDTKV